MESTSNLVRSLGALVVAIALTIYLFVFWTFSSFGAEIFAVYQNFRIHTLISSSFNQYTSLIIPLLGAYIFAVFYLSGSKYFKNDKAQRNPRSNVLMEISKVIQFTMPVYLGFLLIAVNPQGNTLLAGIIGILLYGVLQFSANILSSTGNYMKCIKILILLLATSFLYLGFGEGVIYSELAIMSIATIYIYLVQNATESYYSLFTRNYDSIARNYLSLKNSSMIFLESLKSSEEKGDGNLANRLHHLMISTMRNVPLIKGGNFMIFVILVSVIFALNLSIFSLIYILVLYPLTVVRIPLLEYRPEGPVNLIGSEYEAIFITDENDAEGYYTIITSEGEKKISTDGIDGYEIYSDEEAVSILKQKLDG